MSLTTASRDAARTTADETHRAIGTATTEAPARVPLLVRGGAEDGCIAQAHFADAETSLASHSLVQILPDTAFHAPRPI